MRRTGRVHDVNEELRGADLIVDAALGATTLTLEHLGYFDDRGGQARLRNVDTDATEVVTYLRLDDDAGTLTLGAGTLAAWPAATTRVDVMPEERPRIAEVLLDEAENEQDVINATIPAALYDRLPLGTRHLEEDRETVLVATEGLWLHEISDVLGQHPTQTGEFLDETTLPPPPTSDGNAPLASPAAIVISGIGILHVRWAAIANADPVMYDVHVSTTPGFTPNAGTKVLETAATAATIKTDAAGAPLVYGTDYRVRLVARDDDGSAAAGAEGNGTPVQVNGPDVVADSILGRIVAANEITADLLSAVLVLAGSIKTASTGQRVEIDPQGIRLLGPEAGGVSPVLVDLPTNPGQEARFAGEVEAAALEVLGSETHRGISTLAPGAAEVLSLSVPSPVTAPTLVDDWETVEHQDKAATLTRAGLSWDATDSLFWEAVSTSSGERMRSYNASGSLVDNFLIPARGGLNPVYQGSYGVVRVGTRLFHLGLWDDGAVYVSSWLRTTGAATAGSMVQHGPGNATALGFGYDGTDLVVVDHDATPALTFSKYGAAGDTPTFLSTTTSTGKTYTGANALNIRGFAAAESGWWVAIGGGSGSASGDRRVHKYSTAGAYQADNLFGTAGGGAPQGLAHDGTRFWTLDSTANGAVLVKHTGWTWTTESPVYWVGYTWHDNGSGAETTIGPRASISRNRRARLRVTTPTFPAGVDRAIVYMNRGASEPTGGAPVRFSGFLQVEDALTARFLETFDNAGTPPENPGSSGFGSGTPAKLVSSDGSVEFDAAGRLVVPGITRIGRRVQLMSDFTEPTSQAPLGLDPGTTGGASFLGEDLGVGHRGVWNMSRGTTGATDRAWVQTGASAIRFGDGEVRIGFLLRTGGSLSDGTNRYRFVLGFTDNIPLASINEGVFFLYQDNINGGAWQARKRIGGVETTDAADDNGGAIVLAATTWYKVEIVVNAAGTVADLYVNDVKKTTFSGLPTTMPLRGAAVIEGVLGGNSRSMYLDAYHLDMEISAARY